MYRFVCDLHDRLDCLIGVLNRCLCFAIGSGVLFAALAVPLLQFFSAPDWYLGVRGAQINYLELSAPEHKSPEQKSLDPDWDGLMAGAETGYAIGKHFPFVGPVFGPALGAAVGYTLDRKF